MQSSNPPPDGLGREYRAWFGFWAELVVLGVLAIAGGYFASHGGGARGLAAMAAGPAITRPGWCLVWRRSPSPFCGSSDVSTARRHDGSGFCWSTTRAIY